MARSLKFGNRLSGGTSRLSPWPLKHVHPNPAKPRSTSNKKTQDSKGFRLKPFGPVCVATQGFGGVAAAHGFDLKDQFAWQRKVLAVWRQRTVLTLRASLRGNARF
jgi:hypothetical protein